MFVSDHKIVSAVAESFEHVRLQCDQRPGSGDGRNKKCKCRDNERKDMCVESCIQCYLFYTAQFCDRLVDAEFCGEAEEICQVLWAVQGGQRDLP